MKELEERYIEERLKLIQEGCDAYDATKEAYRRVFSVQIQSNR